MVTRKGIGFVAQPDGGPDLRIPPRFQHTAFHGDIVEVLPFARQVRRAGAPTDDVPEGEVVAIVERNLTTVTGTLRQSKHFQYVVPDDRRIGRDIYVSPDEGPPARIGDKVVVRLAAWEDEHQNPEGAIVEVLGASGDARVEVLSVARTFGLPASFPAEVEREAAAFGDTIPAEEIKRRLDLRGLTCVTIDPEDAKDFDDAVSLEPLAKGHVRLGVHIADVSHYVREGTALDAEAYRRGTSVYMVNEVVPMLPERLSNDLCSLRARVDRLAFSVLMDLDAAGSVTAVQIGRSVIHSARRFAYEEVQQILERGRGEHYDLLSGLRDLSRVLFARREKEGAIDFGTPEAKFTFDQHGLPSGIKKKARLDAHRLIEEAMLLANRAVARSVGAPDRAADVRPFLYRVHDLPDPQKMRELGNFVRTCGFSLDTKEGVSSRALQKLLKKVRGSEVENLINEVALRTMAKAIYSEKNIGHYGLGFPHYTHFTSPIRRYPDLVVHRLLDEYRLGVTPQRLHQIADRLPEIARQSSDRERVAVEAERASVKVMQVEYMKRHVGDEFEGVIGGVTNFGLFVEITDLLIEGLVSVRDLTDDYYLFDERQYALRGRSRGKTYRLGDKVRVQVVAVKPEEREIDLTIV
jgi:ribonuclease R